VLIQHPFDSTALQRAHAAVNGHPQAYATALRCAAKRTDNPLAAAYWLTEAARVHESVDDLGGAIALLSRAWEYDQNNARTRELLAGCMARLSVRVGIGLPASVGRAPDTEIAEKSLRPVPVESGLRPPPMDSSEDLGRDTLPGLFGLELLGTIAATAAPSEAPRYLPSDTPPVESSPALTELESSPAPTAAEPSALLTFPSSSPASGPPAVLRAIAELATGAASPASAGGVQRTRRDALFPPPPGPDRDSEPSIAAIPLPLGRPKIPESALASTPEDVGTPTLRSSEPIAHLETIGEPAPGLSAAPAVAPAPILAPALLPPPPGPDLPTEEAYEDPNATPSIRPAGDGLVGAVFEALHELHFSRDVKEASHFVKRVIEEKMQPSVALVHLYDINSRHFVVMSALGDRAEVLAEYATPDDDALAAEIMRGEEAMLVLDPASDPRLTRGRWRLVEPKKSVLCAPVAVDGRYLGLLEIADPKDGSEFNEEDRNVLTYVATAFAKYLAGRGVVLDEEDDELRSAMAW
jgi:hypothetical protein